MPSSFMITPRGAPIEATSSQKAEIYRSAYRDKLETLGDQLIGSFVFLWGQKQERTPTWFGLFTEAGEKTGRKLARVATSQDINELSDQDRRALDELIDATELCQRRFEVQQRDRPVVETGEAVERR